MEVLDKPAASSRWSRRFARKSEPKGAFFWLSAFYLVYCARPEDWIPGLNIFPVAKTTALAAVIGMLLSLNATKRKLKDLPRESYYLLAMIGVLFMASAFSPVWRGGAINHTIDFGKVYIAWVLTFLLISDFAKLKRVMFIQTASVAVICVVSVVKGHSQPRLEGVLGGIYSNPNDLAFAVVLSLPFCLAFLLTTKSAVRKVVWCLATLCMLTGLFLTASRGGFVTLVVSGAVALWYFGVKGKRLALIVVTGMIVALLMVVEGRPLMERLEAIGGDVDTEQQGRAYGSYEQRRYLIQKAIEGIERYPLLGVGTRNFEVYSGEWREVHVTYLQIAVEGGIPALILYLMFFYRGFANLRKLRKRKDLDPTIKIFVAALHSSLVGFVVGALFSPEAYQYFPYFAVVYTAALLALVKENEQEAAASTDLVRADGLKRRFVARPAFSPR